MILFICALKIFFFRGEHDFFKAQVFMDWWFSTTDEDFCNRTQS